MNQDFSSADLFAGVGGIAYAFKKAGFKTSYLVEMDPQSTSALRLNFPDSTVIEDRIENVSVAKNELPRVDVLTAGFPCQPFSFAGRQAGFDDPRGGAFFEVTRLLREYGSNRPSVVFFENVKGLLNHDDGKTLAKIIHEVRRAGYWFDRTKVSVLNTATHTRLPQERERLFMVGYSTQDFLFNDFEFPKPIDVSGDIWDVVDYNDKKPESYYFENKNEKYLKMFEEAIAKGEESSVYLLRRNYVRENRRNRAFTLTANMGLGGHNVPVIKDAFGVRQLTPEECAALQGFDTRDFSFPENIRDSVRYYQMGNSVTVPLVQAMADTIHASLAKREVS